MKLADVLARCDRVQRGMPFKIAASAVIVLAAIAAVVTYFVVVHAPAHDAPPAGAGAVEATPGDAELSADERSAIEAGRRMMQDLLTARASVSAVGVGAAIVATVALVIVWLGLGLTYLALAASAALVAVPLALASQTGLAERTGSAATLRALSKLIGGMVLLTGAFTALMQAGRALVAAPHPVTAIARNVLAEAVRMKISIVFIVLLIFGLSLLPEMLDDGTPLRYRVQAFLTYGTGGAFWLIAILTLFFAVSSVTFEQRDRQVWQTATKPVSAWQYVLGKWLGVVVMNAVLLVVCGSAIFMFTEYLRQQPAVGESAVVTARNDTLSQDRLVLESQILTSRRTVPPTPEVSPNDPEFIAAVREFIEQRRVVDRTFATTEAEFRKVNEDLYKSASQSTRSIPPAGYRVFHFEGLGAARSIEKPLTLRYRIDAGSNHPADIYHVSLVLIGQGTPATAVQAVALGHWHTVSLAPGAVRADGTVDIQVFNGDVMRGLANPLTITFPADGIELSYPVGSFRWNFVRVAAVLWLKLAFLAMVAVAVSTFLSFPVACLVAFGTFLLAEMAGFLTSSLQYYQAIDDAGNTVYWKAIVRSVGVAAAWLFETYADLDPIEKLVDGRYLEWSSVARGVIVIGAWTLALYAVGAMVFRRRELAIYSGQ